MLTTQHPNIAILGCRSSIARAIMLRLVQQHPHATMHAFSQTLPENTVDHLTYHTIDYQSESSLQDAANTASGAGPLDLVLVANGILHAEGVQPEKALKDLSYAQLQQYFLINTCVPTMIAKHFLPKLAKQHASVFAAISARVGSISDNRLGGWYGYRASKAALNMMIKNAAIEMRRTHKQSIVVGLHPGTVDTPLSQPFQKNVPPNKQFTPEMAAQHLINVITHLQPEDSGHCFAWDGQKIPA